MIEYEEDDQGKQHNRSLIQAKPMMNFLVSLPNKNLSSLSNTPISGNIERKSPSAKYVRKEGGVLNSSTNNLKSTLKNKKRTDIHNSNGNSVSKEQHRQHSREPRDNNYQLLLRLREVIEQMRQNQNLYKEDLNRLKKINERLQQQNKDLIDTLKKYEHRERQLTQRLKTFENDRCLDHEIIIQSLSNMMCDIVEKVIDGQLQKIIELQRQKITAESCSLRSSKTVDCSEYLNHESTPSFPPSSPHPRLKEVLHKLGVGNSNSSRNSLYNRESQQNSPCRSNMVQQEQLDTFRKRGPSTAITTYHDKNQTEEILMEIDNCLDSLSRRKRQLM